MYCILGNSLNALFEDELASFTDIQKNVLFGAVTGGLYKSTLGVIPFFVGAGLGAGLIGGFNYGVSHLNSRGLIEFDMRF